VPEFPQPPVDMVMPQTAQLFATIGLWLPATALFVAAAVYWRRSGSPVYLLGMFGGLIAAFNEPIADILLNCYHAEIGQWKVFSAFGRDIPLWAVGFYPIYFGGLTLLIYTLLRRGVTRRTYWIIAGVVVLGNVVLEWPVLPLHMYLYYGDQPYRLLGFPVLVGVLNTLGAVLGATVMAHFDDWLTGPRRLLVLVIPAWTNLAAYGVVLPHLLTLNSDASVPVKYLGTTAAIALAIAALDGIGRFAAHRFPPVIPAPAMNPTPVAAG
jgi:hypothetical protein